MSLPALFISHGAPTLAIEDGPAHRFLKGLGRMLPQPRQVLVVSAHWETAEPAVSVGERPRTIHDFAGFAPALQEMVYAAPGAPGLGDAAARRLEAAGLRVRRDAARGLDHGAWVPLSLMYPRAEVPVAQLSIQPGEGPGHHLRIGEALRPLRDEGTLILASGSLTHNLAAAFAWQPADGVPDWVTAFQAWIAGRVAAGDRDALLEYRSRAPYARQNHPTDEHLLPLFVALGAGSPSWRAEVVHSSHSLGVLAMDVLQIR